MRTPRRPRSLSSEEALLWGEIARLVTPLRAKAVPAASPVPSDQPPPKPMPANAAAAAPKRAVKLADLVPARPAVSRPAVAVPVAVGPGLERRERRGLERGTVPIEARLDLHGLYQAEAHAALIAFLTRARAAGLARVLVVTGKGLEGSAVERGILRRSVPHWLRGASLRGIVLGFEEAARRHGGSGALYVRLRRR